MITAEELRAIDCDRKNCHYCAAADAIDRQGKRIAELEEKLAESIDLCQQTAAALLRGGELAVKAQDVMKRQAARIAELEAFAIESTSLRMDLARELSDLKMTAYDEDCRGKPPQSYEEALEKFKALLNRLNRNP